MGLINIGNIVLEGFEVPSSVEFGGKQRLNVHKLIGGGRVIDVLGRDDAAFQWQGILSGADASTRARTLDIMRVEGSLQTLTWDAFCYAIIISNLRLSFCSQWWIPYQITCTVQQDLSQEAGVYYPSLPNTISNDLTEVGQLIGSSGTENMQSISTLLLSEATVQPEALRAATQLQEQVSLGIMNAEAGFASADLGSLVSSAGSLAQLCCAQGYLDRSVSNMTSVEF